MKRIMVARMKSQLILCLEGKFGIINSSSQQVIQAIVFPKLTKNNSDKLHQNITSNLSSRVFKPMLGPTIVKRNAGKRNRFACRSTRSGVLIGSKLYRGEKRGDFQPGTKECYFAIRAKCVAHRHHYWENNPIAAAAANYDPEKIYFGRLHAFARLELSEWNVDDRVHFLGECTLWQPAREPQEISMLPVIKWKLPLNALRDDGTEGTIIEWVQLKHIVSKAGIAPEIIGWPDREKNVETNIIVSKALYIAFLA